MRTASFFTYRGPGRISIARYAPRDTPPGFKVFKALAPGPWFKETDINKYRDLFFAQLAKINAQQAWDALHHLAGDAEPTLLCWERPPFTEVTGGNWCHRRFVAEFFADKLGVYVPEYEKPKPHVPHTLKLF